jgi:glycosyltransferase involved in cell wall biosynthesis
MSLTQNGNAASGDRPRPPMADNRARGGSAEPRLRICTLAACPFPANHGTPGSIREMAEAVAELGHEVHVVTYHIGEPIPIHNLQLHRIPAMTTESKVVVGPTVRRPLYDLQMVLKALEVIHRHRPHLIHAHGYEAALVAFLCKLATGLPVIYSGHNTMGDELASYDFIRPRWAAQGLARLLDGLVPRIGTRCLPHSANIELFLHRMGLRRRCEPIINFGIDVTTMANGDGASVRQQYQLGNGPVVVYAGVLDEFQRIDLLLDGVARALKVEPELKLLMVVTIPHEGHISRIRRKAEELKIDERVIFTSPQPLTSIRHYLAASDVAVVPRPRAPGFPIKLLNYMAAKRPCLLFASSASHGLTHRHNVYLVNQDTGAALGDGIVDLLRDDELRQRLARNGNQFVKDNHDRRVIAQRLCAAYYRTLKASGRASLGAVMQTARREAEKPSQSNEESKGARDILRKEARPQEVFCDVGA